MCEVDKYYDQYRRKRYEAMAITAKVLMTFTATNGGENIYHNIVLSHIESEELGNAWAYTTKFWEDAERMTYDGKFSPVSWEELARKAVYDRHRFEVALWQNVNGAKHVVGMVLGSLSKNKKYLVIKWLDIRVGPSYIGRKALPVILECAEQYAKLLTRDGVPLRKWPVLIRQPSDSLVFKQYGYEPYYRDDVRGGGNYLGRKELNND